MLRVLLLLCAASLLQAVPLKSDEKCGYESCTDGKDGFLNVHIVPHTHDDVGWLKTVDQYYYGSRNNIQKAGVQYILDSVIKALWEDPKRKFTYVETAFFWKWWVRQPEAIQQKVHALVRQGRLQFAGGAWSMNDEATVNYQSTIDQFTWGLHKLNKTFGQCGRPRTAWQIDPFGHSKEFASLLATMGYDGLFLGRIDFQDKAARLDKKNMGMIWRGDDALGTESDIFTAILYNTYSPPPGFCFDVLCNDEPIIDDPDSPMYNVEEKVSTFINYVREMADAYRTGKLLLTMGGDFTYQDADMWYTNLDKLIEYTNLKSAKEGLNITLFYSTPSCYLKAVKEFNPTIPTKQDDFFPYASDPHAYWTGYYTSRPTVKFFERQGNNFLQALKQLQVLGNLQQHNQFVLDELKSAMGIMQHHDAITGTEKQHVTRDYERILTQGIEDALIIAKQAFNKFQNGEEDPPILEYKRCVLNESMCSISENNDQFVVTVYNPLGFKVNAVLVNIPVPSKDYTVYGPNGKKQTVQFYEIPESVLKIPTRESKAIYEAVFLTDLQPLSIKSFYVTKTRQKRDTEKSLYDKYDKAFNEYLKDLFIIKSFDGKKSTQNLEYLDILKGKNEIFNQGHLAEIASRLESSSRSEPATRSKVKSGLAGMDDDEMRMLSDDPMVVERYDEDDKVYMTAAGGKNYKVRVLDANTIAIDDTLTAYIKFNYYEAAAGKNEIFTDRASGAYIFRPKHSSAKPVSNCQNVKITGAIFDETQTKCDEIFYAIRIYHTPERPVEIHWVAGPIDVKDGIGKEYVLDIDTYTITNGEFYTDSNSRQVLKRILNKRPQYNATILEPIAGNYYPVTGYAYLKGQGLEDKIVVVPDRPEGAASLVEGEMEFMLHRRLLHDDAFGVDEALNETVDGLGLIVRGSHDLLLYPSDKKDLRKTVIRNQIKPIILFADAKTLPLDKWKALKNEVNLMKKSIPEGLHLLTLEPWGEELLIRVENYMDAGNPDLEVDLNELFRDIRLKGLKETTLGANQWMKDFDKLKWNTESGFVDDFNEWYSNVEKKVESASAKVERVSAKVEVTKIRLKSQQIRTFVAAYEFV